MENVVWKEVKKHKWYIIWTMVIKFVGTIIDDNCYIETYYTKKDIEALIRKEIITEFGKEEFKRIFIELKIEGAAGETKLQRGLYITIKFKDKKNFEKAVNTSLKNRIYQKIINRSCISMPIIISINNLKDN